MSLNCKILEDLVNFCKTYKDEITQETEYEFKKLVENNVNKINSLYYGISLLHFAATYGNVKYLRILLFYGADTMLETQFTKKIAEELALEYNEEEAFLLLIMYDIIGNEALTLSSNDILIVGKLALKIRDNQEEITTLAHKHHALKNL